MDHNQHHARLNTIQSMILEGGFAAFPGWKTFSYSEDFGASRHDKDGTARFVFDTLSILKMQGVLNAHDKADLYFSVQLTLPCYQALCQEVDSQDAENNTGSRLIEYIRKVAPDAVKEIGLAILTSAISN
ncbi:hypothetical protein EQG67_00390 [Kosakonia cowanii]|uniref:hypothetical protein n=1 Tax=Kosakonia cowanii TaxID=208223 RepID=UPI000FECBF3D|nr:hypothetical protein [Kosakonia cowanii]QAR44314.1 hypothetical protein EQG67_00390 [Kosakonia cowanii]